MTPFADRLAGAVAERQSNLCLGLDPGSEISDVAEWAGELIAVCGEHCVAIKPQLACYEIRGAEGWAALSATIASAHEAGLLVIADGKRGDVPHTATIYGKAMTKGLGADAFTANPLPGGDSLDALIEVAAGADAGVFVLARMSNPGAADFFDAPSGSGTLADAIAGAISTRAESLMGESGLSGLGAVIGATAPEHLARLRAAMPDSVFLMPGVGAQGGRADGLGAAVGSGPASVLFPVSRGIAAAADPAASAARHRDELWAVSAG